ncbi:hypothetical protein BX589_12013 [Paraburkholderia fungorum]|nr:hypothetical protein BX589_12013 [Paraburkholderia fungorum]
MIEDRLHRMVYKPQVSASSANADGAKLIESFGLRRASIKSAVENGFNRFAPLVSVAHAGCIFLDLAKPVQRSDSSAALVHKCFGVLAAHELK